MTSTDTAQVPLSNESAAALWKAEGFAVETPAGRLGIVEQAVRIPGLERPPALAVRVPNKRCRVILVPVTDVAKVDVERRVIRLRAVPDR